MKRSTLGFLIYWLVAGAAIVVLILWAASISYGGISDCHDATCRVSSGSARGTGCVFEIGQDHVFVLTNAHVVGNASTVDCEFWRHGHRSQPVRGQVVLHSGSVDAAVIAVPQSAFAGILPAVVPLARRDTVLRPGETVLSVGCANGGWATGWKGHVLGYQGGDLHFVPTPANGRSGSAIFDAAGERIVGLLRARTTDDRQGIAVSVQSLYQTFRGKVATRHQPQIPNPKSPIPNLKSPILNPQPRATQCPDGACPVLPFRHQQQRRDDRQDDQIGRMEGRMWPTMPSPTPAPAPNVDLAPIAGKLDRLVEGQDRIADLLDAMHQQRPGPQVPVVPVEPPPDTAAQKAAEEAKAEAAAVGEASQQAVKEVKEESSRLREAVVALVGDQETLKERFEARLAKVKEELGEDASRRDIARAYVKDLAQEKLADGTLGLTGGKILGGALGLSGPLAFALGLGLWMLSRRIGAKVEAGDPLVIQRVFDRLGDKIDDLRNRLHDAPAAQNTSRRRAK